MLDVGVDLHKRFSQVATLDECGELRQHRVEHADGAMEKFLRELEPQSRIAVEATGNRWWFVDLAEGLGHHVKMSDPRKTQAIAGACFKYDQVDAERLAHLQRLGYLPTVWIPPAPLRYAKEVMRYRGLLVRMRTALRNHLRGMLRKRNLQAPTKSLWTKEGRAYAERVELNRDGDRIRGDTLGLLKSLDALIGHWDQELERRVKSEPLTQRLMTIKGVGAQTAFGFRTFVGEIERFARPKKLSSYFGLVPREHSSGDQRRLGHITKAGDGQMRHLLVEAALTASRKPGPLREYYRRMVGHKGKAKARVALAHRLVTILFWMWKKGLDYRQFLEAGARQVGVPVGSAGLSGPKL
jgi:transposase